MGKVKDVRTKNNEVYLILNKIKSAGSLDKDLVDDRLVKKINKYVDFRNDKISLKDNIKVYKML